MSRTPLKEPILLDQQLALSAYLQALLLPQPAPESAPVALPADKPGPAVSAAVGQGSALVAGGETTAPVVLRTAVESTPDDVPDWAQAPFQALLFQVAGLTLAVPLAKLNGVTPWDAEALRPTPGHSERFLGLLPHHGRNVKVVDTARVVVPPERLAVSSGVHGARFSRVVVVGGGEWGLAADSVNEVVELAAEGVKWRSTAGRRPWLAGTVISQMCALLDVDALVELMSRGDP